MPVSRPALAGAVVAVALVGLSVTSCGTGRTPDRVRPGWSERGVASWYGHPFHGRTTASGEVYDMHGLTAAHRTLPFGTILEVRNRDNGRSVRVRVTDRGPFVRGRILDLSYSAARSIDMIGPGLARVEITVLGQGPVLADTGPRGPLSIQVGAFQSRRSAREVADALRRRHPDVRIEEHPPWHRVRVGLFSDRRAAEETLEQLLAAGYAALIVSVD